MEVRCAHTADMSGAVQIFLANARLDDPAAMATLLAPLRDGGAVARSLESPQNVYAFVFDRGAGAGRYIVSDGTMVSCFSVAGVTLEEAASIAKACEANTDWSLESFQTTVALALGGSIERVN